MTNGADNTQKCTNIISGQNKAHFMPTKCKRKNQVGRRPEKLNCTDAENEFKERPVQKTVGWVGEWQSTPTVFHSEWKDIFIFCICICCYSKMISVRLFNRHYSLKQTVALCFVHYMLLCEFIYKIHSCFWWIIMLRQTLNIKSKNFN